jgi:hypothetical protein
MSTTDTARIDEPTLDHVVDVEGFDDVDDESWLAASQPKGMRVRLPLAVMTLGLALILGLWGGANLEARQARATVTSAGAATTGPGGGRGGGLAGAGTATAGGLSGTVASVEGSTIMLTTANGSTVRITLLPSTAVTRTAAAASTDIAAGESITVRGQTASDGTTTAQSVAIVPASSAGG